MDKEIQNNVIEVSTISKAFGGLRALENCSLNIQAGSITGLIGPNGSGKTTLFNAITGYERIDSGDIRFQGKSIAQSKPEQIFKLGIGRTFQLTRIFPKLTVLENMHVAVQRQGKGNMFSSWSAAHERRKALELLDFVGITKHKDLLAGNLSYGQRKLLEFAFILIADPKIILLDEPAGGVNPTMILYLADRIRELHQQGLTFLIVEHNMEFVMNLCQQVAVMHQGNIIAQGTGAEVRSNPAVLDAYLGGGLE
ncbi:ABC transporter ATP-binding protein [Dictyobacter arantiisoli]|uniref:ABC transporter ATP-binding protein n=1 Tax=Dictyobacter arantiisoli TaxID=2014874 RepID=A0A5A5TI95_9CHLR|nr:ABC transporter ATP-binding protein [Dictyobacter arantiisoli]GCF11320.1 ABC transporter ATP-binding protein [Dictyobacter arantiisoli]